VPENIQFSFSYSFCAQFNFRGCGALYTLFTVWFEELPLNQEIKMIRKDTIYEEMLSQFVPVLSPTDKILACSGRCFYGFLQTTFKDKGCTVCLFRFIVSVIVLYV